MKLNKRFNQMCGEQYFIDGSVLYAINNHKKKITATLGTKKSRAYAIRIMLMEGGDEGWQFLNKPVLFAPKRRKR